jgi:Rieske Fe-S protein
MQRERDWRLHVWPLIVAALIATTVTIGVVVLGTGGDGPGSGWVRVGTTEALEREGVTYIGDIRAFVVPTPRGPIALYARSPHLGEPISYCHSSGWFEDRAHGAMFDGLGRYVLGPAPRGLDRFQVRVVGEDVWVDPTNLHLGPSRGERDLEPSGPLCTGE